MRKYWDVKIPQITVVTTYRNFLGICTATRYTLWKFSASRAPVQVREGDNFGNMGCWLLWPSSSSDHACISVHSFNPKQRNVDIERIEPAIIADKISHITQCTQDEKIVDGRQFLDMLKPDKSFFLRDDLCIFLSYNEPPIILAKCHTNTLHFCAKTCLDLLSPNRVTALHLMLNYLFVGMSSGDVVAYPCRCPCTLKNATVIWSWSPLRVPSAVTSITSFTDSNCDSYLLIANGCTVFLVPFYVTT
jgi:hypothetical protein